VAQHTPLSQNPVTHASAPVHASPCFFLVTHLFVSQNALVTQSAPVAHEVLQPVAPQANGAQSIDAGGVPHTPLPSQNAAPVEVPPTHAAGVHTVEAEGYVQALVTPSQLPAHVPVPAHAARPPLGAPLINLHVPTLETSLHDSHCPVHARSQHTPSTQKSPAAQAPAEKHSAPLAIASPHASAVLVTVVVPTPTTPPVIRAPPAGSGAIAARWRWPASGEPVDQVLVATS
jgi:hypothetical protein